MRGYTATTMCTPESVTLWHQISNVVGALPEEDELRCHELARAVAMVFAPLDVVDGKYGMVEHSWCRHNRLIVDVYCCGRLPMVQLVDTSWMLPHAAAYKPGPVRTDIDEVLVATLYDVLNQIQFALKETP